MQSLPKPASLLLEPFLPGLLEFPFDEGPQLSLEAFPHGLHLRLLNMLEGCGRLCWVLVNAKLASARGRI